MKKTTTSRGGRATTSRSATKAGRASRGADFRGGAAPKRGNKADGGIKRSGKAAGKRVANPKTKRALASVGQDNFKSGAKKSLSKTPLAKVARPKSSFSENANNREFAPRTNRSTVSVASAGGGRKPVGSMSAYARSTDDYGYAKTRKRALSESEKPRSVLDSTRIKTKQTKPSLSEESAREHTPRPSATAGVRKISPPQIAPRLSSTRAGVARLVPRTEATLRVRTNASPMARDSVRASSGEARATARIKSNERAARDAAAHAAEVSAEVRIIQVDPDRDGQRIDNFLFTQIKGVPKSLIYRLLRTGQVRVNGKRAKQDTRLVGGDNVRIPPVRVAEEQIRPAPASKNLDAVKAAIVFEDKHFLVLDKPSGMATHGGSGINHGAIELLRAKFPDATLELVHRLDRDTSGVLVVSKKRSALRNLQELMRANRVSKKYLALLVGVLDRDKVVVDVALTKQALRSGERMVQVDEKEGKPSRSIFRVIERFENTTLVEVTIETGRTHQIRVHAAHLGHAVAGDEKYGDKFANKQLKEQGLKRLFLHAKEMSFEYPDGPSYSFNAGLSDALASFVEQQKSSNLL